MNRIFLTLIFLAGFAELHALENNTPLTKVEKPADTTQEQPSPFIIARYLSHLAFHELPLHFETVVGRLREISEIYRDYGMPASLITAIILGDVAEVSRILAQPQKIEPALALPIPELASGIQLTLSALAVAVFMACDYHTVSSEYENAREILTLVLSTRAKDESIFLIDTDNNVRIAIPLIWIPIITQKLGVLDFLISAGFTANPTLVGTTHTLYDKAAYRVADQVMLNRLWYALPAQERTQRELLDTQSDFNELKLILLKSGIGFAILMTYAIIGAFRGWPVPGLHNGADIRA